MKDPDQRGTESPNDRRLSPRVGVLKSVKIIFARIVLADTIIDGVVLDRSAEGVRVRTPVVVEIPEWVTLKFPDEAAHPAQRRWMRGAEIGFRLVATDSTALLDAMIAGLTIDQRHALVARIEASLISE